jgi:RHS repeat-associated protein
VEYDNLGQERDRQLQARYHYYKHGPLKRVEIGEGLQGIDYIYTLNGWLKSINNPEMAHDPGNDTKTTTGFYPDVFGMTLDYYSGDYSRNGRHIVSGVTGNTLYDNYNGNISSEIWKNIDPQLPTNIMVASYKFDYQNQFSESVYGAYNPSTLTYSDKFPAYSMQMTYDKNGNIQNLLRNQDAVAGSSLISSVHTFDNMSYDYFPGTNQVKCITDQGNPSLEQEDFDNTTILTNFAYNEIGQARFEDVENGQDRWFKYDAYGKVTGIYTNPLFTTSLALYYYDDRGFRYMKDVQGEKTYYVRDASGNVVSTYSESAGLAIQFDLPLYGSTKLGTAIKDAQGENILSYLYELSDHLGNVRAVIQDGYSGSGQTYSYADYYPGGFVMSDRQKVASDPYRFGYQGEFAEKDPETGFNQFEARLYDSRIGRWNVPDPSGQYWSPYNGMGNNPINGVDPDGRWFDWWIFDENGRYKRYEDNDLPNQIVFENSKSGDKTFYDFSDFGVDISALNYNINKYGDAFSSMRFIYRVSNAEIDNAYTEFGVNHKSFLGRLTKASIQSSHSMDFTWSLLADMFGGVLGHWTREELNKDYGPFFIFEDSPRVYNFYDAGNFVWGNSMRILGFTYEFARWGSLKNDPYDTTADQLAIFRGYYYNIHK